MKNTLNNHINSPTLQREFSPDIIMFLNSVSESEMRNFMTFFQRESTATPKIIKTAKIQSPLPKVSREERETLLSTLQEDRENYDADMDSEYLIKMLKFSRKNKEYAPIFDE